MFICPRSRPCSVTLLSLALVAGCTRDPDPGPPANFPVRLLPESVATEPEPIVSLRNFKATDLAGWQLISWRNPTAELTAADNPHITMQDGMLLLHDPESALVRLFEFAPHQNLQASVELDACGKYQADGPCAGFLLVKLDRLAPGESLEDLLKRKIRSTNGSQTLSVGEVIVRRCMGQLTHLSQRWNRPPDQDGIASASVDLKIGSEREAYALVLPARTPPARLRSIQVTPLPYVRTLRLVADRESGASGPTILKDILRIAAFVPSGGSLTLEQPIPAGAEKLSFSLGIDPVATAGSVTRWFTEVERGDGHYLEVARGQLTRTGDAEPQEFQDHSVDWPEVAAQPSPKIRFRVSGPNGLFLGQPMVRGPSKDARPNLLLISLDTLRADRLGCYGYEPPTSPFLDSLAASSTLFLNNRGVAPYTLPTHATILTGLMPQRHGAVEVSDRLDANRVAYLPRLLAKAGYVSAAFAAGGFVSHDFGFSVGFDRFGTVDPILSIDADLAAADPKPGALRSTHNLDAAAGWIEEHAGERWFLFLHSFIVHEYEAPERDLALFRVEPLDTVGDDPSSYLGEQRRSDRTPSPDVIEHLSARYDATIHYADRMLAGLFQRLEQRGLLEQTVVVITSDHGEEFFEHGGLGHATSLYAEMLNVPWIIRVPGGAAGNRILDLVSQADLTPTVLDLLGLPGLAGIDGHSRAGLVVGGRRAGPTTPLYAQIRTPLSRRSSLQVGQLKVIRGDTTTVRRKAPSEWQLFDLDEDPGEQRDLAGQHPDRLQELRGRLTEYESFLQSRALTGRQANLSAEVLRKLNQLGYK